MKILNKNKTLLVAALSLIASCLHKEIIAMDIFSIIECGDYKSACEFILLNKDNPEKLNEVRIINFNYSSNEQTPLMYAIKKGEINIAELLINTDNVDINKTAYENRTPLHLACALKIIPVVEILLTKGAKTDAIDSDRNTPLHDAFDYCLPLNNYKENHPDCKITESTKEPILSADGQKCGEFVNTKKTRDPKYIEFKSSIENLAFEVSKLLLSKKEAIACINKKNKRDLTPFLLSISVSNLDAFKLFLENGADINTKTNKDETEISDLFENYEEENPEEENYNEEEGAENNNTKISTLEFAIFCNSIFSNSPGRTNKNFQAILHALLEEGISFDRLKKNLSECKMFEEIKKDLKFVSTQSEKFRFLTT